MKINSNIGALQASRSINATNSKIQKSLERLSSGYKINHVSDDPTGTAVSSKVKAQLYGLRLASKNSSDGISLVQTAEGAMSETHEMLKRMRELAVQSANDTNTPEDRQKVQLEVDQLIESIDEISDVTEFNKMKLLNGSLSNLTTVSKGGALSADLDVKYMSPNFPTGEYMLSVSNFVATPVVTTYTGSVIPGVAGEITLNRDKIEISATDSLQDIETKLSELADLYDCVVDYSGASFTLSAKEAGEKVDIELGGSSVSLSSKINGSSANVNLISGFSSAAVVRSEGNRVFITEGDGAEMQIDLTRVGANGIYKVKIEDKGQLKLQTGANEEQRIDLMIPGISSYALGLSKTAFNKPSDTSSTVNLINVKNAKAAEDSIARLDKAIAKVSDMRSTLGAYQNRLEHTVKSLDINESNTADALSRIQDTDMALEMSNYTLNNVILQSGISMLSQANERPQQLLQLLR